MNLVVEEQLKALGIRSDEILSTISLSDEIYTVFLSGSVVEGYANKRSDLDIYVVYKGAISDAVLSSGVNPNQASFKATANWVVDIEHWTRDRISNIAREFTNTDSRDDLSRFVSFNLDTFSIVHRIRIGLPILHPEHFQELQLSFDYKQISRILTVRNIVYQNTFQEDAAGAIKSYQPETALLTARQAMQLAVDAYLHSLGETNSKGKWRFLKLKKINDPALFKQYWELETRAVTSEDDAINYAKACIRFAANLVIKAQANIALPQMQGESHEASQARA